MTPNHYYRADLFGFIEAKDGKLTRFDVVAKGPMSTQPGKGIQRGIPQFGSSTFGVAFSLATEKDIAYMVLPSAIGLRGRVPVADYLR